MNDIFLVVILSLVLYMVLYLRYRWIRSQKKFDHSKRISWLIVADVIIMIVLVGGASLIAPKHPFTWEDPNLSLVSPGKAQTYLIVTDEADKGTYYTYWYKSQDGIRHGQLTSGDNVVVFEDSSSKNPTLAQVYSQNGYCGDWSMSGFFVTFCGIKTQANWHWEFHVPQGTVAHMPSN